MRKFFTKLSAAVMSAVIGLNTVGAGLASISPAFVLTTYADSRSAIVNTDRLNVRSGPGTSYSKVASLIAGSQVTITGETTGNDGYRWYSISFAGGSGYARYDFISEKTTYAAASADFEGWMSSQGFPESYKNGLRGLHQKYPNWIFKAQRTGLDWNTVVAEESKIGRNLVENTSISSWKSLAAGAFDWSGNYWPGFDGAKWVQASPELIGYYMDPRNFLSDPYVFQFELQTYDPSVQTREGLEKLLQGTFLAGDAIVPIEGSQIEGGTVIEGSVYNPAVGVASGLGRSGGSTSSGGPGFGGSSSVIGPGAGPGNGSGSSSVIMAPGMTASNETKGSFLSGVGEFFGVINAYANWQRDDQNKWVYYEKSTGTFLNDGWHWLDGNKDGIAECYYFYPDGSLAISTSVDGYTVDADGKWIDAGGKIQTKNVGTPSGSSSSAPGGLIAGGDTMPGGMTDGSGVTGGQLKKVPYADLIMKAAEQSGVSPYVLASAILQEQGKGTSDLISGTSSNYPGIYNFYNTGAYEHDGMNAVTAGLKYAAESGNGDRPWNTIEKAIIGGAKMYGANYVNNGQNTFYLKKFNVQGSNKYNHQFMTNIQGAASEGGKVSNAYSAAMKAMPLEFSIPVYENMPESTYLPTGDGNPNNKLRVLSVDGYALTPTFNMDTESYTLIVDGSSAVVNINAAAIDTGASVSGAGNVSLNVGQNDINILVKAQNGSERVYKLSITRRDNVSADFQGGVPSMGGMPADNTYISNPAGAGGPGAGPGAGPGVSVSVDTQNSGGSSPVIIGSGPM